MATDRPVSAGSNNCRDCGEKITSFAGQDFCKNKSPKLHCRNLLASDRLFCEHCGKPVSGPRTCQHCNRPPRFP